MASKKEDIHKFFSTSRVMSFSHDASDLSVCLDIDSNDSSSATGGMLEVERSEPTAKQSKHRKSGFSNQWYVDFSWVNYNLKRRYVL
jgi:hypothetical protein